MRSNLYFILVALILTTHVSALCQVQDWRKLVPLESNREDVEKIIGKPVKYFDTFGIYQTEVGKFVVNYSSEICDEKVEYGQYDLPANRLINFTLTLNHFGKFEDYISDKDTFDKVKHPKMGNRYFYFSKDNSLVIETIIPDKTREFVYSIGVRPGKSKNYLLCKKIKNAK